MNTRRIAWVVGAVLALGLVCRPGAWPGLGAAAPPAVKPRPDKEPYDPYKYVLSADQLIRQQQDQVKRHPKDFVSYTLLGQAHVRKAREMGDLASYDRAEDATRRALKLKPDYGPAQANLVSVLLAQHRFAEGLELARQTYRKNPREPQLLLLIGDAHLELGHYAEAEKAYRELEKKAPHTLLRSRLARLLELKGQTREALDCMARAAQEESGSVISRELRAWYPFRLGELHFQAGHLDEAAKFYQEALKLHPRYPLALAFLGRVRAAQGQYDEAIKLYGQAVAINADLTMLAELGDLYVKTGKAFLAKLNHDKLEKVAQGKPAYARELSRFYADHDRKLPEALELARKEMEVRKDIYTCDTLAWALYKNKKYREAGEESAESLKLGTRDATLYFHAGLIQQRLGHKDKARDYLERALAINPHFSLLYEDEARRALKELGGGAGKAGTK